MPYCTRPPEKYYRFFQQDCPTLRNSEHVKADRKTYARWYMAESVRTLVYVDESSFNLYTRRTRARAVRGRPAVRQLHFERGRTLNVCLAVAAEVGVVYFELQKGNITKEKFAFHR